MSTAVLVGLLVAVGVWLVLQRGLLRMVFGFVVLSHGVNVLLLAAGGRDRRDAPFVGGGHVAASADPLTQAFVLTAIVIAFGVTVYLVAMVRATSSSRDDQEPPPAGGGDQP